MQIWTFPQASFDSDRVKVAKGACFTGTELLNPRGAWAGGTAYAVNDAVSFGGKWYVSIQAGGGQQPDLSPAYWTPVTKMGIDLKGISAVVSHFERNDGAALPQGAWLRAYLVNPGSGAPNRAPSLDVQLGQNVGHADQALTINGGLGRLIMVPDGAGAAGVVWLNGAPKSAILTA